MGDGLERAVEVVDRIEEVGGKALDGKLSRRLHVAFGALLEVPEVSYGAEVFVLRKHVSSLARKVVKLVEANFEVYYFPVLLF